MRRATLAYGLLAAGGLMVIGGPTLAHAQQAGANAAEAACKAAKRPYLVTVQEILATGNSAEVDIAPLAAKFSKQAEAVQSACAGQEQPVCTEGSGRGRSREGCDGRSVLGLSHFEAVKAGGMLSSSTAEKRTACMAAYNDLMPRIDAAFVAVATAVPGENIEPALRAVEAARGADAVEYQSPAQACRDVSCSERGAQRGLHKTQLRESGIDDGGFRHAPLTGYVTDLKAGKRPVLVWPLLYPSGAPRL